MTSTTTTERPIEDPTMVPNHLIPANVVRYIAAGRRHWHLYDKGQACLGAYRLKKDAILVRDKIIADRQPYIDYKERKADYDIMPCHGDAVCCHCAECEFVQERILPHGGVCLRS